MPRNHDDGFVSRSQKKRDSSALQESGQELARLSPAARRQLPVPDGLAEALDEWDAVKTREAKRRQMRFIGRLMREMDETERLKLLTALRELKQADAGGGADQKQIKRWRERLLDSGEAVRREALADIVSDCPSLDQPRLAHLVEAALAEREKKRPPKHARELFRYLRERLICPPGRG
jgi:ribosome-associated protein